jgi:hypothetical protein
MWASQRRDEKEKEMDIEGMYPRELRLEQVQIVCDSHPSCAEENFRS